MHEQSQPHQPLDPLDELVKQLLNCGGVLSQIISNMVQFDASGRSDPDAVPIPEAAHSLIRSVIEPIAAKHSKRDVRIAAKIVGQATAAMCEDIFTVDPDWLDAVNGRNN